MARRCQCRRRPRQAILWPMCAALLLCCLSLLVNWQDLLLHGRGMPRFADFDTVIELFAPAGGRNTTATAAPTGVATTAAPNRERWLLNETAVKERFSHLVHIAQRHSGPYRGRAVQMMSRQLPLVDTRAWKLHSPADRPYSLAEVQSIAAESAGAGFGVPNIAHYVLPFGDNNLQFHHMVCLLSCLHVMRPDRLLLWYAPGRLPQGEWWQRLRANLTEAEWERRVIMAQRQPPTRIYTVPVFSKEHQSDIMRLEAVLTFGGVYLDLDVIVLKPLEPLRRRECTIGREVSYGLCNGALVAAPNATFLAMWHTAYQVFSDASWVDHSVWLPNSMNGAFPGLCSVEEESMHRPNWTPEEVRWIYGHGEQVRWNWRAKNYVMHLWFRKYGVHHDMDNIRRLNSMFGEMCRFVLFGAP